MFAGAAHRRVSTIIGSEEKKQQNPRHLGPHIRQENPRQITLCPDPPECPFTTSKHKEFQTKALLSITFGGAPTRSFKSLCSKSLCCLNVRTSSFGVKFPGPFFSRELCRKAPDAGADLKVGQWGFSQKTRENWRK